MAELRATVGSSVGLHARPAALFVQQAAKQTIAVRISKDGNEPVDARSILSVIALDARGGDEVVLHADDGPEAEDVLRELSDFVTADHDSDS